MYHGAAYLALLGTLRQEEQLGDASRRRRATATIRRRRNGRLLSPLSGIVRGRHG